MLNTIEQSKSNLYSSYFPLNISSTNSSDNNEIYLLNIFNLYSPLFIETMTKNLPISDSSSCFCEPSSQLIVDTQETEIEKEFDIVMKNPKSKKYLFTTSIKFTGKLKPHLIKNDILIENLE